MTTTLTILAIASAVALGAMSPGPSFLMVARTAVASSRKDALFAALGMGLGAMLFALFALLGVHVVLVAVPWLYLLIKIIGGLYLVFLGVRIYLGARAALAVPEGVEAARASSVVRSFLLGFTTQISNPKTAIFYASIFVAMLPHEIPLSLLFSLPLIVFSIEFGWYVIVVFLLSSATPRAAYLRYKIWIDRMAGGVMGLLGLKLITSLE